MQMATISRWTLPFFSCALAALVTALGLMALGLGYLYRQTHRLLPSVTVHMLLNGLSMAILWIDLVYGAK